MNLDYARHQEYLDSEEHRAEDLFENPLPRSSAIRTASIDPSLPPILRYFLDGSRRTYKVADLLLRGRYPPLIAGQVGVGVLHRDTEFNHLVPMHDLCEFFRRVLAFPDLIEQHDLEVLSQCIRRETETPFELLRYIVKAEHDPVELGIARIMSYMAALELNAMHKLSDRRLLTTSKLLVKDGPLRYKNIKGRGFDITQFRNVVGLSKTFRPSFAVGTGRSKRDVGAIAASLQMGERTPVFKTLEEDRFIGMWYLRLRQPEKMPNPLGGIVKAIFISIGENRYSVPNGANLSPIPFFSGLPFLHPYSGCFADGEGYLSHFPKRFLHDSMILDGVLVGFGLGGSEIDGSGFTLVFPRPLVVGTVGLFLPRCFRILCHNGPLGDRALKDQPHLC